MLYILRRSYNLFWEFVKKNIVCDIKNFINIINNISVFDKCFFYKVYRSLIIFIINNVFLGLYIFNLILMIFNF